MAGEALGLRPDRYGRCACPAHHGKDRNCKLWKDDRGWYCYVCRSGGDVIRLVERVNQCSFPEAVEWLNSAFHLNLPIDRPMDDKAVQAAKKAAERRMEAREDEKRLDMMLFETYLTVGQMYNALERDKEDYRPRTAREEWDERFVYALRTMAEMRETAESMAVDLIGVKE